jgi:adenosine deaminase
MDSNSSPFPNFPLAELHAHLGASIHPSIYWQIAHDQGFKLPKRDYHEFKEFIRLSSKRTMPLNTYFEKIYHPLLDHLSSGTHAVEHATHQIMGGAYRANNIILLELRNNPMKHNHGGTIDLDHVIMAMLRGMERALLEYPKLSAGLIFSLAREFSYEQNAIIVEKAIKYHKRGVIGIDVAGPIDPKFNFKDYQDLFKKARKAGLKITVHTGEVRDNNDLWEALEYISPDRIGHGIHAASDSSLMKEIVKRNIVLEVCPLSNLATRAVKNIAELRRILHTFIKYGVKFTINTDWPEMIEGAQLKEQFQFLKKENILTQEQLTRCNAIAFESSFIPAKGLEAYL